MISQSKNICKILKRTGPVIANSFFQAKFLSDAWPGAGVLMTAPLGVCFLPAFLCLGLAPVVLGLLGQLDIF